MHKAKISQILEQINSHEYQNALKNISSLFGKEKSKTKMSDDESQWLRMLQGVCYAKISHYGEAKIIFNDFVSKPCLLNLQEGEIQHILENISLPLGLTGKVREMCEESLVKQKLEKDPKCLQDIFRMYIKESNFLGANKIAKQLYTATKEIKYLFADIVFQFYHICQLDETKDAAKITQDLKLINLFITKIYSENKLTKEGGINKSKDIALSKQIVRFHYRLHEKQKNYKEMLDILLNRYPEAFSDYLEHLEKLEELFNQDQSLFSILVNKNFEAFRINSQIEQFQMAYESYDRFCSFLFKQASLSSVINDIDVENKFTGKLFEDITEDSKPSFEQIERYYASLESNKQLLKSTQSKHPHFKNAIKCVIQAQFGVLNRIAVSNNALNNGKYELSEPLLAKYKNLIGDYVTYFAIILTFPEEIFSCLKDCPKNLITYAIEQTESLKEVSAINRCIVLINTYKLRIIFQQLPLLSLPPAQYTESLYKLWEELLNHYLSFYKEIYPDTENKTVEKGERLYPDDFIIIAADLAIDFIYRQSNIEDKECFNLLMKVTYLLECALKKSGYNYDIQLRLVLISIVMGNKDRVYDLFKALDIKSVQYETLGFLYLSTALDYGFDVNAEDKTDQALQYYIENLRESKEAMIAAIKSDNFEKIWEFKAYDDWIGKSYFKMMAFYAKSQILLKETFKKDQNTLNPNINYFNDFCLDKLVNQGDQIVWNFDMRVIQSICCNEYSSQTSKFYWNYLGLFNDAQFLKLNIQSTQLLFKLKENIAEEFSSEEQSNTAAKNIQELIDNSKLTLKECSLAHVSDLSNFKFYNKPEYLRKYHTENDLQSLENKYKFDFEQYCYNISLQISNVINQFIALNTKATEEELANLNNIFESLCNEISQLGKKLNDDFNGFNNEKSVFPLTFLKAYTRFYTIHYKFIDVLMKSQEFLKQRLQKAMKKNQDLKKSVQNFQKKIKTDLDGVSAVYVASLTELQKKVESLNVNSKDDITNLIRESINTKINESKTLSIYDLSSNFPFLKRDDVLLKLSEEVSLNYKFLYSVIIENTKDILKLFKTKQ